MKTFWLILLFTLFQTVSFCQKTKPNVILIYADDLGYSDLSCYGAKAISTPNIDTINAHLK